jgi:ribosomal protein S18 acetylase RimI-like enzyme
MEFAEFSLYVYRDNAAAIRCYAALGFEVAEFPADAPLRDVTCYMIRSSG